MGIKAVTSLSLLSASLQFRLTQFGGILQCLPRSVGALCTVTSKSPVMTALTQAKTQVYEEQL